jgi:hypothetical protein
MHEALAVRRRIRRRSGHEDHTAGASPAALRLEVGITAARFQGFSALATRSACTAERRGRRELNHLLRLDADHERRHVDHLLADADVTLLDQAASVVDRQREARREHAGLEAAIQELLRGQTQNVVQLLLRVGQEAQAGQAAEERGTLEQALRILATEKTRHMEKR